MQRRNQPFAPLLHREGGALEAARKGKTEAVSEHRGGEPRRFRALSGEKRQQGLFPAAIWVVPRNDHFRPNFGAEVFYFSPEKACYTRFGCVNNRNNNRQNNQTGCDFSLWNGPDSTTCAANFSSFTKAKGTLSSPPRRSSRATTTAFFSSTRGWRR